MKQILRPQWTTLTVLAVAFLLAALPDETYAQAALSQTFQYSDNGRAVCNNGLGSAQIIPFSDKNNTVQVNLAPLGGATPDLTDIQLIVTTSPGTPDEKTFTLNGRGYRKGTSMGGEFIASTFDPSNPEDFLVLRGNFRLKKDTNPLNTLGFKIGGLTGKFFEGDESETGHCFGDGNFRTTKDITPAP